MAPGYAPVAATPASDAPLALSQSPSSQEIGAASAASMPCLGASTQSNSGPSPGEWYSSSGSNVSHSAFLPAPPGSGWEDGCPDKSSVALKENLVTPEMLVKPLEPAESTASSGSRVLTFTEKPTAQELERRERLASEAPSESSGASSKKKRTRASRWDQSLAESTPGEIVDGSDAASRLRKELQALIVPAPPTEENGEEGEDGSWEHRRRAREMVRTANLAEQINKMHDNIRVPGSSMMQLPPEIAAKFEAKVNAVKEGRGDDVQILDESGKPIEQESIGFQMLQKMGWKEGGGLGAYEQGRTLPIIGKNQTIIQSSGVTHEPVANDDKFEHYRKKMMLAYRFRPNPLNNPRRSYDGYETLYDQSNSGVMSGVLGQLEAINTQYNDGVNPDGSTGFSS